MSGIRGGGVGPNASWVMVTGGPPPPEQNDRETLPSHKFVCSR